MSATIEKKVNYMKHWCFSYLSFKHYLWPFSLLTWSQPRHRSVAKNQVRANGKGREEQMQDKLRKYRQSPRSPGFCWPALNCICNLLVSNLQLGSQRQAGGRFRWTPALSLSIMDPIRWKTDSGRNQHPILEVCLQWSVHEKERLRTPLAPS